MGHEFSGVVEAVGDGVEGLTPGDNVVVEPCIVCDECDPCRGGSYHLCVKLVVTTVVSEISDARKERARSTGVADHVLDPREDELVSRVLEVTSGKGADVAFECAGVDAVLDAMLGVVKPAGVVVNVAIWGRPATVDLQKLVLKEIDLRGTIAYFRDHAEVIRLVQDGKVDLAPFISHRIDLADLVDKGLRAVLDHDETAVKIIVRPDPRPEGQVPQKQLDRWLNEGGALPPQP